MKIPKEWGRVLAWMRAATRGLYLLSGSSLALAFMLGLIPSTSTGKESGIQNMIQQLDMLDQLDFQQFVAEARKCTEVRDFVCADGKARLASKRATSSKNKEILALVQQGITFERQVVQREESERVAREEEARQQREEIARQRVQEAARLQRQENEAQREREAAYARQESERNSAPAVNYGAAMMEGFNSAMAGKARIDKIHNEAMVNIASTLLQRQRQEQEQRDRNNAFTRQQADEARRDQARQEQARNAFVSQSNSRETQRNEASRTTLSMEQQQREARQRQLDNLLADNSSAAGGKPSKTETSIGQNQNQRTEPIASGRQGGSPDRAAEEKIRIARADKEQADRERSDKLKAERVEKEREAAKKAEAEKKQNDKANYLQNFAIGTRLKAIACYGETSVVGVAPKIRPEVVGCVDVHYRAQCEDSAAYVDGIANNFVGMSMSCFGDTYRVEPKPACASERVRVTVREARACNE